MALQDEPVLVSQLVRIAQLHLTCDTIQAIASMGLPSDAQSKVIQSLLSNFEAVAPYVFAMDGERLLLGEWAFNFVGLGEDRRSGDIVWRHGDPD